MGMRARVLTLIVAAAMLGGCGSVRVGNDPFRTNPESVTCAEDGNDCADRVTELHGDFSLSFIEFTERGNQFRRERTESVYDHIRRLDADPAGVAVIVFVHGWKHNANWEDSNVQDFRRLLADFAANEVNGKRKVAGIYVGWRGMSYDLPAIRQLTYWDRKAVAEEVGSGGVTEVLATLKNIVVGDDTGNRDAPRNAYLIIGHSFGGAIVLSALHDVLVENLATAYGPADGSGEFKCELTARFADGVVLLNPAIEANRILQIKELSSNCYFPPNQPNLLHVISSDGDKATSKAFKVGQWLDLVLTWDQEILQRRFGDKQVTLDEHDLDIETVGNYVPFRTGRLERNATGTPKWNYHHCGISEASMRRCGIADDEMANHVPVNHHDPVVFLKTDGEFIENHNDVFNCDAKAYLATIALEGQSKKQYYGVYRATKSQVEAGCGVGNFDFGVCLQSQLELFECQ